MRQQHPLTPGPVLVEQGVDDLSQVIAAPMPRRGRTLRLPHLQERIDHNSHCGSLRSVEYALRSITKPNAPPPPAYQPNHTVHDNERRRNSRKALEITSIYKSGISALIALL